MTFRSVGRRAGRCDPGAVPNQLEVQQRPYHRARASQHPRKAGSRTSGIEPNMPTLWRVLVDLYDESGRRVVTRASSARPLTLWSEQTAAAMMTAMEASASTFSSSER